MKNLLTFYGDITTGEDIYNVNNSGTCFGKTWNVLQMITKRVVTILSKCVVYDSGSKLLILHCIIQSYQLLI